MSWGCERCLEVSIRIFPCDLSWVGSIFYLLACMKPRAILCVSVYQKGREKGRTFFLLSIWITPESQRAVRGGEHHPLHLPGGETEARHQSSTSQCCLMGESQHSLNHTSHIAQTHSQLGTIPVAANGNHCCCQDVAGGCCRQCWLSQGQLDMLQPAPVRLFINQAPCFAVVGTVLGPLWEQRVLPSHNVCKLKRETCNALAFSGTSVAQVVFRMLPLTSKERVKGLYNQGQPRGYR